MGIKATIMIDDDRWAKHPYGVKFDDEECNREFYTTTSPSMEPSNFPLNALAQSLTK